MKKLPDWNDGHFKDRVDPVDPNFRLIELRIPHDALGQPNYAPREYASKFAAERLRRFCAGYLNGYGDLTMKEAEKVIRKSHAADKNNTPQ